MRPRKPSTIREVAEAAGVSAGTVSRVMSGDRGVHPDTRDRVRAAVEALGYRPNPAARQLSSGRTLTIAILAPFFTRPSVTERLRGALEPVAETPFELVIRNVATPPQRSDCFRRFPDRHQADGVLLISLWPDDEEATAVRHADLPVVLIDAEHPSLAGRHRILVDDVAGARAAVAHLAGMGHERIAFLGDRVDDPFRFRSGRDRHQGYTEALAAAGLSRSAELEVLGAQGRSEARRLAQQLLQLADPPTAIVAASDTQAFGVLAVAHELGVSVPEQLSVVGYDDIEAAELLGLTTVRQPLHDSGRLGMELLLEMLRGAGRPPSHHLLATELVERRTTAPPRS